MSDGPEIQYELAVQTGQQTVPSVWVNGSFLGVNDETQKAYQTGQLTALLQELQ
jgi:glutaredoxin-related protein